MKIENIDEQQLMFLIQASKEAHYDLQMSVMNSPLSYYFFGYLGIALLIILRTRLYKTHILSFIVVGAFFIMAGIKDILNVYSFPIVHSILVIIIFGSSIIIYLKDSKRRPSLSKFNNRYHNTIKLIPILVSGMYIILHIVRYTGLILDTEDYFNLHMTITAFFVTFLTFYPMLEIYLDRKEKERNLKKFKNRQLNELKFNDKIKETKKITNN